MSKARVRELLNRARKLLDSQCDRITENPYSSWSKEQLEAEWDNLMQPKTEQELSLRNKLESLPLETLQAIYAEYATSNFQGSLETILDRA